MADTDVYIGIWTNWSKSQISGASSTSAYDPLGGGSTFGSTLTLPSLYGNFVVALLALFVSWSGSCLWTVICFGLHRLRSTGDEKDTLHHQQQVLLRNGLADVDIFWRLLNLSWIWRPRTEKAIRRNTPLITIAILHLVLVFGAGVYSSRFVGAKGGNEVLILSSKCGFMDFSLVTDQSRTAQLTQRELELVDASTREGKFAFSRSAEYSRSCYTNKVGNITSLDFAHCGTLQVPLLASQVDSAAACPFPGEVCTTPGYAIDSGEIDSHLHLGINAPPKNRLKMGKKTTCAPVAIEKRFSTNWTNRAPMELPKAFTSDLGFLTLFPGDICKYYDIGSRIYSAGNISLNYTFAVSNYSLESGPAFQTLYVNFTQHKYSNYLTSMWSSLLSSFVDNTSESEFVPNPYFSRTDADVNIFAILKNMEYSGMVSDPLYMATVPTVDDIPGPAHLWKSNDTISTLGCIEQWQFCAAGKCTALGGLYQNGIDAIRDLDLNAAQWATYEVLYQVAWAARLFYLDFNLAGNYLLAMDYLYGRSDTRLSNQLDENFWQAEVANLHNITLSLIQLMVIGYSAPPNLEIGNSLTTAMLHVQPTSPEGIRLCKLQKIRSQGHASFSVFGLALLILTGALIISLKIWLPSLVFRLERRTDQSRRHRQEWNSHDVLQLHRAGLQAFGLGPWTGCDEDVPVLVGNQKFGFLSSEKQSLWESKSDSPDSESKLFMQMMSDPMPTNHVPVD
jgi:hypothetical protein